MCPLGLGQENVSFELGQSHLRDNIPSREKNNTETFRFYFIFYSKLGRGFDYQRKYETNITLKEMIVRMANT